MTEEKKYPFLTLLIALLFLDILVFASVARREFSAIYSALFSTTALGKETASILNYRLRVPPPSLVAHAYFVESLDDFLPLFSQRPSKPLAPASLTKLLTVAVASEILSPEELVTFTKEVKNIGEKMSDAREGEMFLRNDAIALALISSDNDAAYALAETSGKKEGAHTFDDAIKIFVDLMNKEARAIGLRESIFKNPAGLDEDGHVMSAEDIGEIIRFMYKNHPEILVLSHLQKLEIHSVKGREYSVENTNDLLTDFPEILASKTGLTDKAKGALAMLYPLKNNAPVIIVILGSDDRFGDGRKVIEWLNEYQNYQ